MKNWTSKLLFLTTLVLWEKLTTARSSYGVCILLTYVTQIQKFSDIILPFTLTVTVTVTQVFLRTVLDVIFIWMQWQIYPYKAIIPEVFECTRKPCPHTVECWPSRVKEKTIFFHYMYIVACITCLINVAELCYIGPRRILNAFTCCVSTKDLKPGFDEKSNKSVKSAG